MSTDRKSSANRNALTLIKWTGPRVGDADGMRWWARYATRQPDGTQQLVEGNRRSRADYAAADRVEVGQADEVVAGVIRAG
jgi:hypothetical protein